MQVSGISSLSAPQGSGDPALSSGAGADSTERTKVLPVVGMRDPETQRSAGPPAQFWRTLNGGPDPATHIAPPSIMQIKITQMLDEQAIATKDTGEGPAPPVANRDKAPGHPFGTAETAMAPPATRPDTTGTEDAPRRRAPAPEGYEAAASVIRERRIAVDA
ncbi:hypothetical protein [Ponticoccus litoralis]|uniref:Uncharacterized protein n=1 Tax=Ponticoccus litoralis TaxID=422297 RepID=A0AAW9S8N8_9RHOB